MDTRESTSAIRTQVGRKENMTDVIDLGIPGFRFSASYASRYNNCHASANLTEAIPGFEHPAKNDLGRKGQGTNLHEIFQEVISAAIKAEDTVDSLRASADLLHVFADVYGKNRTALIKDEKAYIMWWFSSRKKLPPMEWKILRNFLRMVPVLKPVEGGPTETEESTAPRLIHFMADSLSYVADIVMHLDGYESGKVNIIVEAKKTVTWLRTQPKTTVDLIIDNGTSLHVLDLKMGDIEVSPIENQQLMYYAETWRTFEHDTVVLHIMQRGYTDYWSVGLEQLDAWRNGMQASEDAILAGDMTFSPGSHCTFCPANPVGRGDKGNVFCQKMMAIAWGPRDAEQSDRDVLGDDDD